MERKNTPDVKPLWKKITQGTLYPFPNKRSQRVKFKETIEASEEEIAKTRNDFELVRDGTGVFKVSDEGKTAEVKNKKPILNTPPPDGDTYEVEAASKGWFNVVSSTGKVMNDKKLRQGEAQALKESLEAPALGE